MRNLKRMMICLFIVAATGAKAQQTAIKTNLLYWGTTTPNIGLETKFSDRWSGSLFWAYNPWTFPAYEREDGKTINPKIKHWLVTPEIKYWPCRTFEQSYWGLQAIYAQYNAGGIKQLDFGRFENFPNNRYEGYAVGAGISYGYQWAIGDRWGLELGIGAGYLYFDYDIYECMECGKHIGENNKHYFGPTKAAVSLVYFLK